MMFPNSDELVVASASGDNIDKFNEFVGGDRVPAEKVLSDKDIYIIGRLRWLALMKLYKIEYNIEEDSFRFKKHWFSSAFSLPKMKINRICCYKKTYKAVFIAVQFNYVK